MCGDIQQGGGCRDWILLLLGLALVVYVLRACPTKKVENGDLRCYPIRDGPFLVDYECDYYEPYEYDIEYYDDYD